jgi:hypothetical protein
MRDLNADLALCGTATEGPLYAVPHEWPGNDKLRFWVDGLTDGIGCFVRREDAVFHVEAREGWPEAIRRAIATEGLLHGLVDAINRGDLRQVRMSSGTDYAIGSAKRYLSR